jgi:hypothetical protein
MTHSLATIWSGALRALGLAGIAGGAALALASPAEARSDIAPYLEVQQVLEAELNGGGDTLTYTTVSAGIDATVESRRAVVQVSYRYDRFIEWEDDIPDQDAHSGIASAHFQVMPALSLDAGALAARTDADGSGIGFISGADEDVADVYGVYVGPTLSTNFGALAVNGNYRFGYVHVNDHAFDDLPGDFNDGEESSTSHTVNGSVGMAPGELPVGWTVAAGYAREKVDRLDQRWEGWFVRGDVVLPISPNFAVTGGVGYEDLEASSDDFLRDSNGLPVLTPGGNPISDESQPRLLAYDQSGVIWDVGVIWRPSPRLELQARAGERYDDMTYVGTLQYDFSDNFGLSIVVYDTVTSFGRLVVNDLSGLPKKFKVDNRGLTRGINGSGGCVFGNEPGTGACFDDALRSIHGTNFRARGVDALVSGERGAWSLELGASYAQHKYLTPDIDFFPLHDVKEEVATIYGGLGRELSHSSGIDLEAYASWFDSGVTGEDNVFGAGATATYYRSFLFDRLYGEASVGIYTTDDGNFDSTIAALMLGLRYQF